MQKTSETAFVTQKRFPLLCTNYTSYANVWLYPCEGKGYANTTTQFLNAANNIPESFVLLCSLEKTEGAAVVSLETYTLLCSMYTLLQLCECIKLREKAIEAQELIS